jgi:NADPH2:quinone reductase
MVESGAIQPVVYKKSYSGLGDVRIALEDLEAREVYGRAVITVSSENEAKPRI